MAKYTVDVKMFKNMVLTAASYLEQNKPMLNDLNVFPVPDGDTGTNMSMTMLSAAKEVGSVANPTIYKIASALNTGALKGARGNSGVILSQIFRGFAVSVPKDKKELEVADFAAALRAGVDAAYKAVMRPKEGTVLTVARTVAESAEKMVGKTEDVAELFDVIVKDGNDILMKTPDMLPVLKEAGVVDAGGAGLLIILKGFKMVLDGEELMTEIDFALPAKQVEATEDNLEIEFGYCTEFFIKNIKESVSQTDIDALREKLMMIGDCVLVVGDTELVKVHVHTNGPGRALQLALKLGDLSSIKIDNMREQHREIIFNEAQQELKEMAIAAVSAGSGLAEIFGELNVDAVIEGGQSMNPSIEDILKEVKKIQAKNVFILPNNKNIILAAEQTAGLTDQNIIVIPTKSFPQGMAAALAFNPEAGVEENETAMNEAINGVASGMITYAVRDSKMNGDTIKEHEILGLLEDEVAVHGDAVESVISELAEKMVTEDSGVISLYFGEDVTEEQAEEIRSMLEEKFSDQDVELYSGGQPVYSYIISVE